MSFEKGRRRKKREFFFYRKKKKIIKKPKTGQALSQRGFVDPARLFGRDDAGSNPEPRRGSLRGIRRFYNSSFAPRVSTPHGRRRFVRFPLARRRGDRQDSDVASARPRQPRQCRGRQRYHREGRGLFHGEGAEGHFGGGRGKELVFFELREKKKREKKKRERMQNDARCFPAPKNSIFFPGVSVLPIAFGRCLRSCLIHEGGWGSENKETER